MVPELAGPAILDNDGKGREDSDEGGLAVVYWERCEIENYFITPEVLRAFVTAQYAATPLFAPADDTVKEVLDLLITERVFGGKEQDFTTWKGLEPDAARLLWEARTERIKLSDLGEEFFRCLADRTGHAMLMRKGDLYRLVAHVEPDLIPGEVRAKLDLLANLFAAAEPGEEA